MSNSTTRYAVVRGYNITKEQVAAYLPSNYRVNTLATDTDAVHIIGEDSMGWTLEDYVIPRLAPGNMVCTDILNRRES